LCIWVLKVQDGLGRKVGDVIQYTTQFAMAFAVAFYFNWELTLVLLSAFPFIALSGKQHALAADILLATSVLVCSPDIVRNASIGMVLISAVSAVTTLSLEQYALAGSVASETLAAIRTVSALNAQPDAIRRYRRHLFSAMEVRPCLPV
jgi:ATP-binding cassette subfamily B (MDR/TAP) protein 1